MTERSESERAELVALADNLACDASTYQAGSITRKLLHKAASALRRLAAQDQKPAAWQCAGCGRLCGDPKADFDDLKSRGFLSCCPERRMEPVSSPPAAGWDEATRAISFAIELDDDIDRLEFLVDWQHGDTSDWPEFEALRHNAPPDSGAGKSAPPGEGSLPSGESVGSVMPDHGGADAGVKLVRNLQSYLRVLRSSRERKVALEVWKSDIDLIERAVAALSHQPAPVASTEDDPSTDERWQAGLDFAMIQLCTVMGVDPHDVTWDAATEETEGDVRAIIWNILRAKMGEDWKPAPVAASAEARLREEKSAREVRWLVSSARAFLRHFNPCNLAEDKSQQWQSLSHQCDVVERTLSPDPHASDCDKQIPVPEGLQRAIDDTRAAMDRELSNLPKLVCPSDRTADVTVEELAAMIVPEGAQVIGAQDAKQIAAEIFNAFTVGRR